MSRWIVETIEVVHTSHEVLMYDDNPDDEQIIEAFRSGASTEVDQYITDAQIGDVYEG